MIENYFKPPYYAVIFTTVTIEKIDEEYEKTSKRMIELAKSQKGYLGIDSVRSGVGITVSYWRTLEDIKAWRDNLEHRRARKLGVEKWYKKYELRICKVEKAYSFNSNETD